MDWRISRALADRVLAEAASCPKVEICGLLFGGRREVVEARSCRNVADDPGTSFEIDPHALIAAHKNERSGGPTIAGCYHSHPNGVASPSDYDRATAFAGLWIIVASGALHGWEADGEGRFEPARLVPS